MTPVERQKMIMSAYAMATKDLRKHHSDEFSELLQEKYAELGIVVRTRLTGERKRERDIAKHRAAIAALTGE